MSLMLMAASYGAESMRGNPAARLLPGEFASERWALTARFDSGHFLFADFLITNAGIGDRNAAAIGHIIEPDGTIHHFRNGRSEDRWTLSDDGLRLEIGSSIFDQHPPISQLRVDKRKTQINLHFQRNGPAAWSDTFAPDGAALDLLDSNTPISGTFWVGGMKSPVPLRGVATLTHSWAEKFESDLIQRQIEFFALQQNFSLYLTDVTTPSGTRTRWLVVRQPDAVSYESHDFTLSFDGQAAGAPSKGYPMPRVIRFQSEKIQGQIQLDRLLLSYNPFGDLPGVFRFLLSFKTRPRWLWAVSPFKMSVRANSQQTTTTVRGVGVTRVSFLNPM